MAELEIYDDRIDAALAKPPFAAFCRLHGQNAETDAAANSTARYGALPRMPFMKRLEPLLAYLQLLRRGHLKALCGGDPSGRPQKLAAPSFSLSNPPSDFFRAIFDQSGPNAAGSASRTPASPVKRNVGLSDDSEEAERIRNRQKRWGDTSSSRLNDNDEGDGSDGDADQDASRSPRTQMSFPTPTSSANRASSSPIARAAEGLLKKPFELLSVEPYRRSDAGAEINLSVLRTPVALEKTMHFLVQHYMRVPHTPLVYLYAHDVWRYLWDRLRQVRTNWVPQLTAVESILQIDDGVANTQRSLAQLSGSALELSPEALNSPLGKCYQDLVREKEESWRRLRWLEFTVAALSVQSVILCRTREGCAQYMNDKRNFLESIAQCVSDLILAYRAMASPSAAAAGEDHVARHSEFFSVLTLFYGLKQTEKVENFARFCVKITYSNGESAFEPPSESTNLGSVYSELQLVPEMATTKHVRTALRFIHCCTQREWFTFMFLCRFESLTVLQRATLFQSFSYVRFRAIADLVTANAFVSSLCRVRGNLSIATLTDLLLFCSEEDCMLFIKHMGLQELLFKSTTPPSEIPTTTTPARAEYWYLHLCDKEKPLTTPDAILSYMEKNQTKPQLLLPVVPEYMGFSACQEDLERLNRQVYEDLSSSLDAASAQSLMRNASQSFPPLSASVRDASCPVNLMTLLEPYCPAYNEDVEKLVLADAGPRYFKDIPQSREHFLRLSVQQHRVYDTWRAECIARFHPHVPQPPPSGVKREWDPDEFVRVHLHSDHPELPTWLRNAVYDVFDLGIQERQLPTTSAPSDDSEALKAWQDRQRQMRKEQEQKLERMRAAQKDAEDARQRLEAEAEATRKQKAAAEAEEKQRKEKEAAEAKRLQEKKAEEERLEMARQRQREEEEAAELFKRQQRLLQLRDLQRKQQIEEDNERKAAEVSRVIRGAMQTITSLSGLAYYDRIASRDATATAAVVAAASPGDLGSEQPPAPAAPAHMTEANPLSPPASVNPLRVEERVRETADEETRVTDARNAQEGSIESSSSASSTPAYIPSTAAPAKSASTEQAALRRDEPAPGKPVAEDVAPAHPPPPKSTPATPSAMESTRLATSQPLVKTIATVINDLLVNDSATENEPQSQPRPLTSSTIGDFGNRSAELTLPVAEVEDDGETRKAAATESAGDDGENEDEEAATRSTTTTMTYSEKQPSERSACGVEPTEKRVGQRPFEFVAAWLQPGLPKRLREEDNDAGSVSRIAKRSRQEEGRGGSKQRRGVANRNSYLEAIYSAAKKACGRSVQLPDLRVAQFFSSYYVEDAANALLQPSGLSDDTHTRASSRNLPSGPEWSAHTHQLAKSVEFLTLLSGYAYHDALWHRILSSTRGARRSPLAKAIDEEYAEAVNAGDAAPSARDGRAVYDPLAGRADYVRRLAQLCPGFVPRTVLIPISHSDSEDLSTGGWNGSIVSDGSSACRSIVSMDASLVLVVPEATSTETSQSVLMKDLVERLARMITGEATSVEASSERQVFVDCPVSPQESGAERRTAAGGSLRESLHGTNASTHRSQLEHCTLNPHRTARCTIQTTVTLLMKTITEMLAPDFLQAMPTNATVVLPMLWIPGSPCPALDVVKAIGRGKHRGGSESGSLNGSDAERAELLSSTSSVSGALVFLMTGSAAEDENAVRSVYASVEESVRLRARDELYRNRTSSSSVEPSTYTRATAQLLQSDDEEQMGHHHRAAPLMNRYAAILERLTHSIPAGAPRRASKASHPRHVSSLGHKNAPEVQPSSKRCGFSSPPPPCVVVVPVQTILEDCADQNCIANAEQQPDLWAALCDESVRRAFTNALQSLSDMYAARRMGKTDIVTPYGL